MYELGVTANVASGRTYGLCWGNGLPVGQLVFSGPLLKENDKRNCTLGVPCNIGVEGMGFSPHNMLLLSPKKECKIGDPFEGKQSFTLAMMNSANIYADKSVSHAELNE